MVVGGFRDLFVAIATCAATLIGLLFVAMSIAQGRSQNHPQEIREFRAAAALLAFTNAFTVALFGLVPGTNVGIPAAIVGLIGVFLRRPACGRSSRCTWRKGSADLSWYWSSLSSWSSGTSSSTASN